jgi:hypothetical protein
MDPADVLYQGIRQSTVDVAAIARATGYKIENIAKAKQHLFLDVHLLDRYVELGVPAVLSRFHSDIGIANACFRLQAGTHGSADLPLLCHETAEAWYMRNVARGYSAAHNHVQRRFPAPEL